MKKIIVVLALSVFLGLTLCLAVFPSLGFAEDRIVYHGAFDFPVPPVMVQNMKRYEDINEWIFFPDMTRWIDENNDGRYEFIAIGLGTNAGYGGQVRYRVFYRANSTKPELGPWYWCVLGKGDTKLFEAFNR
ncbi:hypothetical protein ACFL5C_00290 [Candidatus Omnitrophota bacterium]